MAQAAVLKQASSCVRAAQKPPRLHPWAIPERLLLRVIHPVRHACTGRQPLSAVRCAVFKAASATLNRPQRWRALSGVAASVLRQGRLLGPVTTILSYDSHISLTSHSRTVLS